MKLRTTILLALIVALLLPTLLLSWYALRKEQTALSEDLRAYHQRTLDALALGMQEPVWTMRSVLGEPLLDSVMRDERILLISVRNREGIFLEKNRPDRGIGEIWSLTQPIVYQGEEIGEVLLEVTTASFVQRLVTQKKYIFFLIVAQLSVSLPLLLFLLQRKIFLPVKSLSEAAAAFPDNSPKTLVENLSEDDEIGALAAAFQRMLARVRLLISDLEASGLQQQTQLHVSVKQLATLTRVSQAMDSQHDLQSALNSIAGELLDLFEAKVVSISMLNAECSSLMCLAEVVSDGSAAALGGVTFTLEEHPSLRTIFHAGKSVTFLSSEENSSRDLLAIFDPAGQSSEFVLLPLFSYGQAIGLLHLGIGKPNRFAQIGIEFLETIAGQIVGAIEHSRLFNEEHHQRQIAESLQQIGSILNRSLERDKVLIQIMEQLGRVVNYKGAAVFLCDGKELLVSGTRGSASKHLGARVHLMSKNPAARVFRSKCSLVLEDVTLENGWETWEGGEQIRSWIGAPLCIGEKALGVLTVDNFLPGTYSDADVQVLQVFANQAAIAIENARLYEIAQEARTQAEQAARAKSMFLSNISHELRTPLNGILGYTQILEESGELSQSRQMREGLAAIERCGIHLLELINDLLDLAKIESQKLELEHEVFHLSERLDDLAKIIRLQSRQKTLDFFFTKDSAIPAFVYGDEKRISQVLLNLLHNAVKFTEEGRVVFKVTSLGMDGGEKEYKNGNNFTRMLFEIGDSGPGIPREHMQEIFLPFVQVGDHRQKLKGTGLGLHISQNLLSLMGSELHVESVEGEGSKFWFVLSVREAVRQTDAPDERSRRQIVGIHGGAPKILVVDDNTENRKLLMDLLRPRGFELKEACDGREALQQAFEWKPDLILLDLILPIIDGFEIARRLRAAEDMKGVKILVVSASSSLMGEDPVAKIGCDDFLMKPIRTDELLERLRRHLHLEWIEQESNCAEDETFQDEPCQEQDTYSCPSVPVLKDILSYAEGGYVTDLRGLLDELRECSSDYESFVAKIENLLDNFFFERIATVAKNCLEGIPRDENGSNESSGRVV